MQQVGRPCELPIQVSFNLCRARRAEAGNLGALNRKVAHSAGRLDAPAGRAGVVEKLPPAAEWRAESGERASEPASSFAPRPGQRSRLEPAMHMTRLEVATNS